jgi:hypothetical protein
MGEPTIAPLHQPGPHKVKPKELRSLAPAGPDKTLTCLNNKKKKNGAEVPSGMLITCYEPEAPQKDQERQSALPSRSSTFFGK